MRDIDIRRALLAKLDKLHGHDEDTTIVEELGICEGIARVDLAVVNGRFHGFEIKSERDTLNRLCYQAEIYSRALEFVTIIAAPNHLARLKGEPLVPTWWGIWSATQKGTDVHFKVIRKPKRNPSIAPLALVQFLWRDEALSVLATHGLSDGMMSKSRKLIWLRLAESFEVDVLGDLVRARIKERREDWRARQ